MKLQQLFLICLSSTLAFGQITNPVWHLQQSEFESSSIVNTQGWISSDPSIQQLYGSCDEFDVFGLDINQNTFSKNYQNFPSNSYIRVEFNAYFIDSWINTPENQDNLYAYINDEELYNQSLEEPSEASFCGEELPDGQKLNQSFIYGPIDDNFQLSFKGDKNWGINNLRISYSCPDDFHLVNGNCEPQSEFITTCSDFIREVVGNVDSTCVQTTYEGSIIYNCEVKYLNDYDHNPDCFAQQIRVNGKLIKEGEAIANEWKYNPQSKTISFSLLQEELEEKGCVRTENEDSYTWVCNFSHQITFNPQKWQNPVLQHRFSFVLETTLNKAQTEVININVEKDESQDDLVNTNILDILTNLRFCETSECLSYYNPSEHQFIRGQEIFIEHSVDTDEFRGYFLRQGRVIIYGVQVDLEQVIDNQPGKIIYRVRSELAFDNKLISVTSILEAPSSDRRFLQEVTATRDGVQGDMTITIIDDRESIKSQQDSNKEGANGIVIAIIASVAVLVLAGMGIGACVYFRKQKKSMKYQDKSSASSSTSV